VDDDLPCGNPKGELSVGRAQADAALLPEEPLLLGVEDGDALEPDEEPEDPEDDVEESDEPEDPDDDESFPPEKAAEVSLDPDEAESAALFAAARLSVR
jgi:hypothetical protein